MSSCQPADSDALVGDLVRLGKTPSFDEPPGTTDLHLVDLSDWGIAAADRVGVAGTSLPKDQLMALIRATVVVEERVQGFGSVSPVIALFRELKLLDYDCAEAISPWILRRTTNDYVPFGTRDRFGASSLREYDTQSRAAASEQARNLALSLVRQRERRAAATAAGQARMGAVRARQALESQERAKLLSELEALEVPIRLERIAVQEKPLGYFPPDWADVDDATLLSLPHDVASALARKADQVRKGPWRRLLGRVTTQIADPPASD